MQLMEHLETGQYKKREKTLAYMTKIIEQALMSITKILTMLLQEKWR